MLVLAVLTTVFGVWSLFLYRRRRTPRIDRLNASPPGASDLIKASYFNEMRGEKPETETLRSDASETGKADDKVCPTCGERYSFSSFACPKDNSALRTLN